ncbi:hypothetical protein EXM22_03985 [Oceanispirochaeta crateris]|uniref:Uncharacterized protein n=1 Tax=Oceanispirochaeta crateris TaxID=2518645 RepID=A0A5C1QJ55_9SPIO|nr:hypothetical protein [Oceanispirochaeta crateris]QEN07189.1 hypothetical protein EXM22_03985 [Oceanispirochaeta crateris]
MKRFSFSLLLFFSLTILYGFGQREDTSQKDDVPQVRKSIINPDDSSGKIGSIIIENKILFLPENHIKIPIPLDSEKTMTSLSSAESYSYFQHNRPDGPVAILALKDQDLLAWIGDGIRSGMGPEGLSIVAETGVTTVALKSDDTTWSIPAEEEVLIQWRDASWLIYVSGVTKGSLMDQPSFKADIIILRLSSN